MLKFYAIIFTVLFTASCAHHNKLPELQKFDSAYGYTEESIKQRKMGNTREAIRYANEALKLDSNYIPAAMNVAYCYMAKCDPQRAKNIFFAIAKGYPGSQEAQDAQIWLARFATPRVTAIFPVLQVSSNRRYSINREFEEALKSTFFKSGLYSIKIVDDRHWMEDQAKALKSAYNSSAVMAIFCTINQFDYRSRYIGDGTYQRYAYLDATMHVYNTQTGALINAFSRSTEIDEYTDNNESAFYSYVVEDVMVKIFSDLINSTTLAS